MSGPEDDWWRERRARTARHRARLEAEGLAGHHDKLSATIAREKELGRAAIARGDTGAAAEHAACERAAWELAPDSLRWDVEGPATWRVRASEIRRIQRIALRFLPRLTTARTAIGMASEAYGGRVFFRSLAEDGILRMALPWGAYSLPTVVLVNGRAEWSGPRALYVRDDLDGPELEAALLWGVASMAIEGSGCGRRRGYRELASAAAGELAGRLGAHLRAAEQAEQAAPSAGSSGGVKGSGGVTVSRDLRDFVPRRRFAGGFRSGAGIPGMRATARIGRPGLSAAAGGAS